MRAGGFGSRMLGEGRLTARTKEGPWASAVLAVGGAAVAGPFLLAQGAAGAYLPGHPFILVLPAILAASVLLGWQGGIAALSAASAYVYAVHLGPGREGGLGMPAALISFAIFVGIGLYFVAVITSLQSAMARQARLLAEVERARDRSAAAEREKAVLVDELDHRVRNAVASVAAVVQHTLREAGDLRSFEAAFGERIAALGKTHDLVAGAGAPRGLREVLKVEFEPYAGAVPCSLEGPEVPLGPRLAVKLSLVIHELVTNAAKYGGLSREGSGIRVAWGIEPDGRLSLSWREALSVPREPSSRRGSGSRLLDHTVRGLGGSVRVDPSPDGYGFAIGIPAEALAE